MVESERAIKHFKKDMRWKIMPNLVAFRLLSPS